MLAGIRTLELRKVYTSPPPVAAAVGGFSFRAPGRIRQLEAGFSLYQSTRLNRYDGVT